jgi:glycoprotein-N-acetylgalactosamine 3-beta-galactosyltransferase
MALRRSVAQYGEESYLKRITELHSRYRKGSLYGDTTILDPEGKFGICNVGPGRSLEDEGGFKLLTEKIQVQPLTENSPRILCVMYSYRKMRDLLRMQALTWGHQCDGFLAFSTETIPELGIVEILHKGEESYQNMWQKVRSIWTYLYTHYRNDFDYFHLGGDDLYLIVNNLRHFLVNTVESRKTHPQEPVFLGSLVKSLTKEPSFVAGAPGYTLNRHSLSRFVEQALDNCATTQVASHEDRLMSKCLQSIGILPGDTRDVRTGEPQYHDANPHHLYTFRTRSSSSFHAKIALRWEDLPHPSQPNATVGPKHGLEAAARYSIAFHDIYHPLYVARIHVLLHPEICPATTILGRALRMYGIVSS